MRTAQKIYEAYRIPPWLQMHQLRVGAVGKFVCERFQDSIDTRAVILACLFHDMGNILKFDLSSEGPLTSLAIKEMLGYWQGVKKQFQAKYGDDEHLATRAIAKEIGMSDTVVHLIGAVGFSKMEQIAAATAYEPKIVEYGDSRVGPFGILGMKERYQEAQERYLKRHMTEHLLAPQSDRFEQLAGIGLDIEKQLCEKAGFVPEDINDKSIEPTIEELRHYEI